MVGVQGGISALLSPFTLALTLSHRVRGERHRISAAPGIPGSRRFARSRPVVGLFLGFAKGAWG